MAADWSNLSNDMLGHLSSFLPLPDQHRFSAVCHGWRSVANENHHPRPAPELPWLVLGLQAEVFSRLCGEDPLTKKRNFFNLSEQRIYSIEIPELHGRYVCGSSYGWLVAVDDQINGHLLNPFTRKFFDLPPFPPYSSKCETIITEEPFFTSCGRRIGFTAKELKSRIVARVFLSHDPRDRLDFTLMILGGGTRELALWRPGDKVWTMVRPPKSLIGLVDIICFENKIYAASQDKLYVVEMGGSEPVMTRFKPHIPSFRRIPRMVYLANFKEKLLIVMRFASSRDLTKEEYRVLCLNPKKGAWNELDGKDKIALFVGENSAVLVDPTEFCGCVSDSIYFADVLIVHCCIQKGHALGVYNMVSGNISRFCPNDDIFLPPDAAVAWFTPNP